ncbi:MAG TPA: nucleotide exchange factor GrpE [Cyanobacteria bacterium UBA11149]|nr:nucleotide exchange factor GrpE [Cyanobacteria bacterium UBA11367]HBE57735.1 nucleotide exchange factor GrpE [Cyanobacteria bacterium UBA11366]HBK62031.1 nucleotide exchange factor GrpE [Cyanobacteria bacterium UBA11166]HBR76993.1 nucleotide exchange factor GrpE [Cyanobacteria bacterium UBA11159]HBS67613.1 nucleotide exchange factor GrpE [Cyanobacteria bacterium UBA11153]HBW87864.1 nucleotide exchange factor GrpE [Cyanobacteria bacterium UBA11149]HCA96913.1 nucleotide exchange factor GrpE 
MESQPDGEEPNTTGATEKVVTDAPDMLDIETAEPLMGETSVEADLGVILGLKETNEALQAQLDDLDRQFEALKTQSMRMAADFDNFRKRTAKEKEDLEHQIKGNTLKELLPVVDNFERARSQIKPQNDGEMSIHRSYQGVYKQLVDCLKRIGVSPMRAEGTEFDPNLHEAVMRESTDEYPEGVVIEQLMRGYLLGERVLRHAMVKVAAAPMPVVTSEDTTKEAE